MTSAPRWQPDGEPYCLHTLAITAPGSTARLLIDLVNPDHDPREVAWNHLAVLAEAGPAKLMVHLVAITEIVDLVPVGTSPTNAQPQAQNTP